MMRLRSLALRAVTRGKSYHMYRRSFVAIPLDVSSQPPTQTWMQLQTQTKERQTMAYKNMTANDKLHDIIENYRQTK